MNNSNINNLANSIYSLIKRYQSYNKLRLKDIGNKTEIEIIDFLQDELNKIAIPSLLSENQKTSISKIKNLLKTEDGCNKILTKIENTLRFDNHLSIINNFISSLSQDKTVEVSKEKVFQRLKSKNINEDIIDELWDLYIDFYKQKSDIQLHMLKIKNNKIERDYEL